MTPPKLHRSTLARLVAPLLGFLALSSPSEAAASDWPMVLGTAERDSPPIRPFGFVQFTSEGMLGGEAQGLTSPALKKFDRQTPTFNLLDNGAPWGFTVRRARPGLRGHIPGTDARVAYFLMAELGTAAIARDGPTLTDATVTLSYIPGARLRLGQFKMPVMDEAVESNPMAAEWVNFSLPAAQLVNENTIQSGAFVGGASGFRDVGAEVFDTFQRGHVALSYALMVSNGRRGIADQNAAKDVSARTTLSWVFSGKPTDPHRQELSVFAWGHRGERDLDGKPAQRIRSGAGAHLEKEPLRLRAEVVWASGMIPTGQTPPFEGQPLTVDPQARAVGYVVQARVRFLKRLSVGLRYDELHRSIDDPKARRIFRDLSPMVEYDVVPRVRLQATYERRWLFAFDASSDTKRIVDAMGDRVSVQAVALF